MALRIRAAVLEDFFSRELTSCIPHACIPPADAVTTVAHRRFGFLRGIIIVAIEEMSSEASPSGFHRCHVPVHKDNILARIGRTTMKPS
jgi:hypothetical protein